MKKKRRLIRLSAVKLLAALSAAAVLAAGCGAEKETSAVPGAVQAETEHETEDLTGGEENGTVPVYAGEIKDGVYSVAVDSSSSMFKITACELTVAGDRMEAVMTMSGKGYLKVFMGTGEEAAAADEADFIPFEENADGAHTFRVPVEALDMEIECSAFSKRKEKWYDRVLVFRSDSLPPDAIQAGGLLSAADLELEDGEYTAEVSLSGGSGRASVQSPARLRVENGAVRATIVWGSSNYDYMKVDGARYERLEGYETSAFEIPIAGFGRGIAVTADTVAMSQPHEIEYTLTFDSETVRPFGSGADEASAGEQGLSGEHPGRQKTDGGSLVSESPLSPETAHRVELSYADQFSIDRYEDGCSLITIRDGGRFLVVPEGENAPEGLFESTVVLKRPLDHIYLAATSAMDLFAGLDGVSSITLSGTDISGWYIEEAVEAMEQGGMRYAGKYSAPDYELILSDGCDLAVESTMIYHTPEVKEQLERLGIPVLVERSSYESHPLGRLEWIKLYGVLLGKEDEAERIFEGQEQRLMEIETAKSGQDFGEAVKAPAVAFFYINSAGAVNVRRPGDYVAKMIELAGGTYIPQDIDAGEGALSTMNMQMEAFYAAARDADYIVYNSAVDGGLASLDELLEKSGLLADFKAVREGNAWCTSRSMFQETMGIGDMILELHRVFTEEKPDPASFSYLHPLR